MTDGETSNWKLRALGQGVSKVDDLLMDASHKLDLDDYRAVISKFGHTKHFSFFFWVVEKLCYSPYYRSIENEANSIRNELS